MWLFPRQYGHPGHKNLILVGSQHVAFERSQMETPLSPSVSSVTHSLTHSLARFFTHSVQWQPRQTCSFSNYLFISPFDPFRQLRCNDPLPVTTVSPQTHRLVLSAANEPLCLLSLFHHRAALLFFFSSSSCESEEVCSLWKFNSPCRVYLLLCCHAIGTVLPLSYEKLTEQLQSDFQVIALKTCVRFMQLKSNCHFTTTTKSMMMTCSNAGRMQWHKKLVRS